MERRVLLEKLDKLFPEKEETDGLQFPGEKYVKKITLALDCSEETLKEASGQLFFCHHGLIHKEVPKINLLLKKRIKLLLEKNMNLYSMHLPLDMHPVYGGNAQIAKKLKLNVDRPFGYVERIGDFIGFSGMFGGRLEDVSGALEAFGSPILHKNRTFSGRVNIVTGSFSGGVKESKEGDCFVTGELGHHAYLEAKELGVNTISLGHYNSEMPGILKMEGWFKKLGLITEVIKNPTGY